MEDPKHREVDKASEMEQNLVAVKSEDSQTTSDEATQNGEDGSLYDNPKPAETSERCYKCGEVFSDSSDLMEHMLNHRLQRTDTCPICSERFCYSRALKEHLMTHTGYRPYRCSVCNKAFKRASRVKDHMNTHIGRKHKNASTVSKSGSESRQKPLETFNTASPVSESKLRLVGEGDGEGIQTPTGETLAKGDDSLCQGNPKSAESGERCYKCGEVFVDSSDLMEHMMTHSGQKPNTCPICSERFSRSWHLKEHIMTHTGYRPYSCSDCSKGFKRASHLKEHMITHIKGKCSTATKVPVSKPRLSGGDDGEVIQTSTGEALQSKDDRSCLDRLKPAESGQRCYECGEAFVDSSDLMKHMMTHCGKVLSTCSVCGKSLTSQRALREHMMTHTGHRPNKCSLCGKGFIRSSSLSSHMKTHTEWKRRQETGNITHKCPFCNEIFAESSTLQQHMQTHFKLETAEHRCYYCRKLFQHPPDLYRHTTAHTCLVCNQSFCQLSYLNEHGKIHTGQKDTEFSTSNIKESFKELSKLLKHEETDDKMAVGHGGESKLTATSALRVYSCTHCGKGFANLGAANTHVLTHVNKPAPGMKLKFDKGVHIKTEGTSHTEDPNGHVDKHKLKILRTLSGEMLYLCSVCGESFEALPTACSHILSH